MLVMYRLLVVLLEKAKPLYLMHHETPWDRQLPLTRSLRSACQNCTTLLTIDLIRIDFVHETLQDTRHHGFWWWHCSCLRLTCSLVPRPSPFLPSICIYNNTQKQKIGKNSCFHLTSFTWWMRWLIPGLSTSFSFTPVLSTILNCFPWDSTVVKCVQKDQIWPMHK